MGKKILFYKFEKNTNLSLPYLAQENFIILKINSEPIYKNQKILIFVKINFNTLM